MAMFEINQRIYAIKTINTNTIHILSTWITFIADTTMQLAYIDTPAPVLFIKVHAHEHKCILIPLLWPQVAVFFCLWLWNRKNVGVPLLFTHSKLVGKPISQSFSVSKYNLYKILGAKVGCFIIPRLENRKLFTVKSYQNKNLKKLFLPPKIKYVSNIWTNYFCYK